MTWAAYAVGMSDSAAPTVRTAVAGMIAMAVAVGIGRFVYTPILPPMSEALHLSKTAAGTIASANFCGYMAGALTLAFFPPAGSRRTWVFVALAVSTMSTVAMGWDWGIGGFLALRFVGGFASAVVLVWTSAIVMERLATSGRSALSAVHFAGVGAGIALSAAVVALLLARGGDWAAMWHASGALSAIGLASVWMLLPRDRSAGGRPAVGNARGASAAQVRMTVAYGLFGFGYVITATFLVAIVRGSPAARPIEPIIWILVGLGAMPSVWLWSLLARRIGTARAYATAAIAEAVGVLASVLWPGPAAIGIGAVLLGATFMGLTSLGLTRARELSAGDPGRAMAAMTGAFGFGQIVGPVFAGALSDRLGGFLVPSAIAAAGLVLAAWLATWGDNRRA